MEDVEVPPLPPPFDPRPQLFPAPPQKTREDHLRDIREELRKARRERAEVVPACAFFGDEGGSVLEAVVPFAVVAMILETALGRAETAENVRGNPPRYDAKAFLKKLDLPGKDAQEVDWTPDLIRRGLLAYAGYAREPGDQFCGVVRADLEERAEESGRAVRRLEREEAAVTRLLDGGSARTRAAKLLPGDGRDERIAKYERHLHTLLTSTLHELERLQARRDGESVPLPAVADINVTVDTGPG